jgi:two-component sensor histidine kinase
MVTRIMEEVRGLHGVEVPSTARFGRGDRLRTLYFIAAAVLAALVPLILFAGLWVRSELDKGQRDLETYLANGADGLVQRVDSEIRQQFSVLQAIAAAPSLDEPNLLYFHATAERMLSAMPQWASIALIDPADGRQIVNTLRPVGSNLPVTAAPAAVRQVVETRRPAVFTRAPGPDVIYPGRIVLLLVPVMRDDAVRHVLVAGMKAEAVQELLRQQMQDERLLATIVDEQGRVLARSRRVEEFVGRDIPAAFKHDTDSRDSGVLVAQTLDGQWVTTAFRRSTATGWVAAAGIDRAQFSMISYRSTWAMIATGALSLTLAGVLAMFLFYTVMERRITNERLSASRILGELDARLLATTQEALAEQRKAAAEREVLLREIYHRVKNNLQIVQSLFRLGSRDLTPEQREPFEGAVRRIGAMARVHTLLYNSPDLASVDFGEYLAGIVSETAEALGGDERGIRTAVDVKPMRVPLDIAVPLAFIAVELLTNAFKHAFPQDRPGTVTVKVSQDGREGRLVVGDDGVGVAPPAGGRRPLGLTIVSRLVQQIGGTFEEPPPGRSVFTVSFPLAAPSPGDVPRRSS